MDYNEIDTHTFTLGTDNPMVSFIIAIYPVGRNNMAAHVYFNDTTFDSLLIRDHTHGYGLKNGVMVHLKEVSELISLDIDVVMGHIDSVWRKCLDKVEGAYGNALPDAGKEKCKHAIEFPNLTGNPMMANAYIHFKEK